MGDWWNPFDDGQNEERVDTPAVDPNAYNYGGREGGAAEDANRYRQNAANAQQRQAAQANLTQANYAQADQDRALGLQARQGQNQAAGLTLSRALGKTPSIAGMQAKQDAQRAMAQQSSIAASARGPAGAALASQNMANNASNAMRGISSSAQLNAANERLQAEQAAGSAFGAMRAGDAGSQQINQQRSQYDAGAANQMSQFNVGAQMTQRQINDAMTMGMTQNEMAVNMAQLGASQNLQAQKSGNKLQAGAINAGIEGQNAAARQQNLWGMVGLAAGGAGGYAASQGGKADGGPVKKGKTYLTGERGPELVIEDIDRRDVDLDDPKQRSGFIDEYGRETSQPYIVGENGPELHTPPRDAVVIPSEVTVPLLAQSTWGRGDQMTAEDQQLVQDQAGKRYEQTKAASDQAEAYVDPYQRDVNRVRAVRAVSPDLIDEEDRRQERVGKVMTRRRAGAQAVEREDAGEEAEKKAAVVEGKAVPKRGRLTNVLGGMGRQADRLSQSIDTSYHGPTSISAPSLIPVVQVPGRAAGGPVAAGNPYMVGEQGPEIVMPSFSPLGSAHSGGTFGGGANAIKPGGGMNTRFGTEWNNSELRGMSSMRGMNRMSYGGAREEGGPVEKGRTYKVGEKGPEAVVPTTPQDDTYEEERRVRALLASKIKDPRELDRATSAEMVKRVSQRAQDHADEVEAARQRNLRTAAFAEKMGAPVTRNPIDFQRDSPARQAVIARSAPAPTPIAQEEEERRPDIMPLGAFLANIFGGR